jgi:hypothetical protein
VGQQVSQFFFQVGSTVCQRLRQCFPRIQAITLQAMLLSPDLPHLLAQFAHLLDETGVVEEQVRVKTVPYVQFALELLLAPEPGNWW